MDIPCKGCLKPLPCGCLQEDEHGIVVERAPWCDLHKPAPQKRTKRDKESNLELSLEFK